MTQRTKEKQFRISPALVRLFCIRCDKEMVHTGTSKSGLKTYVCPECDKEDISRVQYPHITFFQNGKDLLESANEYINLRGETCH